MPQLRIAQDADADALLSQDPFALVVGMLLDQQFPMEHAFRGPLKIRERFGSLRPQDLADADPESFAALCARPPAVHRFPGSMAARVQALARAVVDEYDGDVSRLWSEAEDGAALLRRIQALPGFGRQKAQILVALLAKQRGVTPPGWERAAGDYALEGYRSVADVVDDVSLQRVREVKKQQKAAAKGA